MPLATLNISCYKLQQVKKMNHSSLFSHVIVPTDRLVVKFSTSPYDKDDLTYMFNLVKEIEEIEGDHSS
jgi:hypothetical protein